MTPISKLMVLMRIEELAPYAADPQSWFTERDAIKRIIAHRVALHGVEHWLAILEPADIWCAKVLDWHELIQSEGFRALDMLQTVEREDGVRIRTTRSPLTVNGARPPVSRAAPRIGEHNARIRAEFGL
jgi:crotonobetainyl-CoA:carnitine CoA-transferase CaiB-like acyl-CoA transferase